MEQLRGACNRHLNPTKHYTFEEPANIPAFIDELILLVRSCRFIGAKPAPPDAIHFSLASGEEGSIEVYGGSYSVRPMCARLSYFASELGAGDFEPYGAHHELFVGQEGDRYKIRIDTLNRGGVENWFRIELLEGQTG
ncbi:MAG TPA: hypothetical protein VHM90_18160 [Phycisphaerae bacterium]|nr:hypothetical protein [Phycisphaerae bacterium]